MFLSVLFVLLQFKKKKACKIYKDPYPFGFWVLINQILMILMNFLVTFRLYNTTHNLKAVTFLCWHCFYKHDVNFTLISIKWFSFVLGAQTSSRFDFKCHLEWLCTNEGNLWGESVPMWIKAVCSLTCSCLNTLFLLLSYCHQYLELVLFNTSVSVLHSSIRGFWSVFVN